MTEDLKSEAYERLQVREQELGHLENEIAAAELALGARWAGHERRLQVLEELFEYVGEREMTLRERALRLRLSPSAIDELLPPGSLVTLSPVDMSHVALNMERVAVLEGRERLCKRREALHLQRRQQLEQAAQSHTAREEALIEREQVLTEAFRRLVEGVRLIAESSPLPPASGFVSVEPWPESPQPDASFDGLEVVAILDDDEELSEPVGSPGDRRASPRAVVQLRVDVDSSEASFEMRAENLGVGGLFIGSDEQSAVGQALQLRFAIGDGEMFIKVSGEVVWVRAEDEAKGPAGMGVLFLQIGDEERGLIEAFVAENLPEEG